jgi:beta-lactamase class A
MKVSDALEQMVTVSHNYAALLLAAKVRLANVANFLASNGFASSQLGEPPRTTAADIALFFEKLYRHEIVNASSSERMLKLLKAQKLNNKIPRYLPPDIVIAHKTGELNAFSHDAGIVYTPKGDYIIVVLTESDDPIGAAESIARLSEAVYAYFQREN